MNTLLLLNFLLFQASILAIKKNGFCRFSMSTKWLYPSVTSS